MGGGGGHKSYGVEKISISNSNTEWTWGLEALRGPVTPIVEGMPRGYKPCRLTPKGDGVLGRDGQGQGGDINSPATQDTTGAGSQHSARCDYGRPGSVVQLHNQGKGAAMESRGRDREQTSTPVADTASVRPEHGTSCDYGLLVLAVLQGDQATGRK